MPPKVEVKSKLPIEYLLSHQYDPAIYKPGDFHEHYQELVKYRDELRKQYDRKNQTRASLREPDGKTLYLQTYIGLANSASANPSKGSRFNILTDDDEGSSTSAASKPTTSATLSKKELDKIPQHERKIEVRKIKEEIKTMKKEMKEQKKKDNEDREEAKDTKGGKEHQMAVEEDEDEADESGQE